MTKSRVIVVPLCRDPARADQFRVHERRRGLYVADGSMIYGSTVANDGVLASAPGSPLLTNQPGRLLSLTAFPGKSCNQPPDCSTAIDRVQFASVGTESTARLAGASSCCGRPRPW